MSPYLYAGPSSCSCPTSINGSIPRAALGDFCSSLQPFEIDITYFSLFPLAEFNVVRSSVSDSFDKLS